MTTGAKVLYEFGPFRVDPEKQLLLRDNQPVPVTPKTFETLLLLLRHSREVVSKDELMKELWPDSFVEEANLSQNIFMLRKALGDSPEERLYIVTLPGKGYRFTAEVRTLKQDGDDVAIASRSRSEIAQEQTDHAPADVISALPSPARRVGWKHWLAIAATVVLLAGAAFLLYHRRQPVVSTTRDTVVIADFSNSTGDSVFDDTLRQGLAVQLEQSPFLQLVSDDRVHEALTLMGQSANARLTPEVAREVCERTGSAAMIEGSIASIGTQYVLGLRARDCQTGEILADEQGQAPKKEEVLKALGRMAASVRTRLGESLVTIEQHNVPLEMATTPSLDALKAYSTAMRVNLTGGYAAAFPLFRRAVELDPQFALAHAHLGLKYSEMGESLLASQSTATAYELRDHASDRERFFIIALYHRQVTGNLEKEQQILQLWADTYPRDPYPHSFLSGFATQGLGQYERSIEEARLGGLGPTYLNLAFANVYLGRFGEAEKAMQDAIEHKYHFAEFLLLRYYLAFFKDNPAELNAAATQALQAPAAEDRMLNAKSFVAAYSGQLQTARVKSRSAVEAALQGGRKEAAATYLAGQAVWEALSGNAVEARRNASAALQLSNGRDAEYAAALAFGVAGDLPRTEALSADLAERFPEDTSVRFNYLPALRALAALQRHDPHGAVEQLEVATPHELAICALAFNYFYGAMYPAYLRGQAYLASGRGAEAAAEFQKIIAHQGLVFGDPIGSLARLQLARAYVMQGDRTKAKAAYDDFLILWKNADPEIPIYKQAKAECKKLQ
jgi:DNA-binding winged helix-turn-helix (wHTH) protein